MEQACDIRDLCFAAGMDPNHYVTFVVDDAPNDAEPIFAFSTAREGVVEALQVAKPLVAQIAAAPIPQPPPALASLDFGVQSTPAAMPAVPTPMAYVYPVPSAVPPAQFIDASSMLRSTDSTLKSEPATVAPRRRARPRPTTGARNRGVAFRAAAGGCGATTVAATVARMLATRGEHIVLGDGSSLPMLPAHFGATHLSRGTWSLLPGRRRDGGAIHILSNADPVESTGLAQGWLAQEMAEFPHPWNRLLLDVSSSAATELDGLEGYRVMVIIVVHPGPAARVRLPILLEEYAEQGVRPFVLLNRFNVDKPSHTAMREDLRKRLGATLLPFEIRASQEVPEALDEGVTVDDSVPDGDVTGDFRLLTDWVQANAGPLAFHSVQATGVGQGDVQ